MEGIISSDGGDQRQADRDDEQQEVPRRAAAQRNRAGKKERQRHDHPRLHVGRRDEVERVDEDLEQQGRVSRQVVAAGRKSQA